MTHSRRATQIAVGSLFLITIIFSLVPVFQTALKGEYRGVPPGYIEDDLYYYGRMKEVADGRLLIGNPYFIEYRDSAAPSSFVTDWIASVPLLLGISFSTAIVLNLIIWSLIFVYLAYLFGRASGVPSPYSAVLAFVAYIEVYWLIYRPVAMQQVFPFFLLFLLAFLSWHRHPLRRRSVWLLAVACAAAFYIYVYLLQIIFTVLCIVFLHKFLQRKWPEVVALMKVAIGTVILSLPAIAYTIYQVGAPYYWQTMDRLGFLESHLPTVDAYFYGRWAIILSVLCFVVQRWLRNRTLPESGTSDGVAFTVIYSGLGLFIMTVSNVMTGKDLFLAVHIGRFITLWVAIVVPILIWRLYVCRREVWKFYWLKNILVSMLLLAGLGFLGSNLMRSLPFQRIAKSDSVTIQEFTEPLGWIDVKEKQPVVIWANDDMSIYVPILTKHYVFWSSAGGLHLVPTSEVEDRFLASRMKALTADEIFALYLSFEGLGPAYRYTDALNKNRLRCLIGRECESDQSMREWIGTAKLDALFQRQRELRNDIVNVMKKYHTSYLIADMTKGEDKYFKSLPGVIEEWRNQRFVVYQLK